MSAVIMVETPRLPPMQIACGDTPDKLLTASQGSGLNVSLAEHRGEPFIIVAVGCPASHCGSFIALHAQEARTLAAGLLQTANQLDGGKGRQ